VPAVGRNHNQRRSAVGRELANRLANEYYERFVREGVDEINAVGELPISSAPLRSSNGRSSEYGRGSRVKNFCTTSSARRRCCARPDRTS